MTKPRPAFRVTDYTGASRPDLVETFQKNFQVMISQVRDFGKPLRVSWDMVPYTISLESEPEPGAFAWAPPVETESDKIHDAFRAVTRRPGEYMRINTGPKHGAPYEKLFADGFGKKDQEVLYEAAVAAVIAGDAALALTNLKAFYVKCLTWGGYAPKSIEKKAAAAEPDFAAIISSLITKK